MSLPIRERGLNIFSHLHFHTAIVEDPLEDLSSLAKEEDRKSERTIPFNFVPSSFFETLRSAQNSRETRWRREPNDAKLFWLSEFLVPCFGSWNSAVHRRQGNQVFLCWIQWIVRILRQALWVKMLQFSLLICARNGVWNNNFSHYEKSDVTSTSIRKYVKLHRRH